MLLELAVELLQPLIIAKIIDKGIIAQDIQLIYMWGAILLVMAFVAFLSGVTNSYFASHASQSFAYEIRHVLFSKVQSFSMATFTKFPTSSLITRLTSDVTMVQNVFFMSLRIMLRAPLLVIGSIAMAFYVDVYLASFLLIAAPFLLVFLVFMVKKGVSFFGLVQSRIDRVNRVLQENLQAVRLVKAYLRGLYEASRFEKVATMLKDDTTKALRIMEWILPVLLFVMNSSLLLVIVMGSKEIQNGTTQIGDLVAIINYTLRMSGAFSMFSFIIIAFSRAKASAERIEEVLLVEDGIERNENVASLSVQQGDITFKDVTFSYFEGVKPILKNISFSVKSGEKLAIMGATGAGKTTLLNLIPRFYEVTSGTIEVDGRDIREWPMESLRQAIGFVPQVSLLFTGSIRENLGWGKEDATDEEVEVAAIQAQIHQAVKNFANGYNTMLGQKGVNLSGGQKQRLSIARALVRKPEILILDDSTSALDIKTEQALWDALAEENATMLVVTQKIRTAKGADKILLMDRGTIEAFGTHEELIVTSKLYREIATSQERG